MDRTSKVKPIMVFKKERRLEAKKRKIEALINLVSEKETSPSKINKTVSTADCTTMKKTNSKSNSYEHLSKLRKELRQFQKATESDPSFYLTEHGLKAQVNIKLCHDRIPTKKNIAPIFVDDIYYLIMRFLYGNLSPFQLRWCKLLRPNKVNKVLFLVIEGLSKSELVGNISLLENLVEIFPNVVEVVFSNIQFASELTTVHLRSDYQINFSDVDHKSFSSMFPMFEKQVQISADKDERELTKLHLLLSPVQLVMENYPIPRCVYEYSKSDGYSFTKDNYSHVTADSPMYAMDCEMCQTDSGKMELTRIAVVDEKLQTVYSTLVKPKTKIINYLTKFSGVTKKMLKYEETRLADVQKHIQEFLPSDAILCGQSLNSDLHALQMIHPYVIDTSVIYNESGIRSKKPSLKKLSQTYLNEVIQSGNEGHSPIEDSVATMKLVQFKLRNHTEFGDAVLGSRNVYKTFKFKSNSQKVDKPENCSPQKSDLKDDNESKNSMPQESDSEDDSKSKDKSPQNSDLENSQCDSANGNDTSEVLEEETTCSSKTFNPEPHSSKNEINCFSDLQDSGKKVCIVGDRAALNFYHSQFAGTNVTKIIEHRKEHIFSTTMQTLQEYDLTFSNFNLPQRDSPKITFPDLDSSIKQLYESCPEKTLFVAFASGENNVGCDGIKSGLCMLAFKNSETHSVT